MNLSFPTKSISSPGSYLAEKTLASDANDPSQLGFSGLLNEAVQQIPARSPEIQGTETQGADTQGKATQGKATQGTETQLASSPLTNESLSNSTAKGKDVEQEKLREAFHNFVGQTFFSQMLSSLRSTQEGAAYFNGGQAEKIFQGQLDQVLSEELTKSSADQIADPMFELFQLQRSR